MAVVETITARLEADTRQFEQNMARAGGTVDRLQTGTGGQTGLVGAERHSRRLERSFRALAFSAAGIPGPLGNVVFALTQLVTKTGPLLAITGIFAGIAIGVARANKELKEMVDLLEKARSRVQREWDVINKKGGGTDPRDLGSLRTELARQIARITEVQNQINAMAAGPERAALREQFKDIARTIAVLNGAILQLTETLRGESNQALVEARYRFEHVGDAAEDVEVAVARMRLGFQGMPKDIAAAKVATDAMTASLNAQTEADRKLLESMQMRRNEINDQLRTLQLRGLVDPKTIKEVIPDQAVLDLRRQVEGWRDPLEEELRQLGTSLGKQFILGIITGMQSMEEFIKSAVIQILSFGVDQLLSGLFSGNRSSGGGIFGVDTPSIGGASGSVIGPASFSLSVGTLPAPTNPFALMRDAEWLRALTGSLIQARANGFRS